ncbi:MAG: glycosyltransferase family 2 protein [Candidatus Omnitrophica bacterium]|nr:glycosyltransferase family 2 protein [Candidatus Omnitrophota bacterium]
MRPEETRDLKESSNTFDFIVIDHSLSLIFDIQEVLSLLRQKSHRGTRLVIFNWNYLWAPFFSLLSLFNRARKERIQNWLSPYDIQCLLHLSGHELIRHGFRLLFPFKIPVLTDFINVFLAKLPLINRLCLTQYFVARPLISQRDEKLSVSVVVPVRNEKGNIETAIQRMPRLGSGTEIIFVEGHSKDGTWEEILRIQEKYGREWKMKAFRQRGEGKGDAVRRGFEESTGDILMILDADLTVPPEELTKFYNAIVEGQGEMVMGSRLVYPLEKDSMRFVNILGNKFFSLLLSWILEVPIKDTLCGTKALLQKNYKKVQEGRKFFGDFDPFGDFDLIFGAAKLHLKILEIPIRYRARSYGQTNIRRFFHAGLLFKMSAYAFCKFKIV